jgi:hypothetical protein
MADFVTWQFRGNRLLVTIVDVTFGVPLVSIRSLISMLREVTPSQLYRFDSPVYMHTEYVDAAQPHLGIRPSPPHVSTLTVKPINTYLLEVQLVYSSEFMKISVPLGDLVHAIRSAYTHLMGFKIE